MNDSNFDMLCDVLFSNPVKVADIKITAGPHSFKSLEHKSLKLLQSMERMGIIKSGRLVNHNSRP